MQAALMQRRNFLGWLEPYLYLVPHAVLFFLFTVYPIAYGAWISLHRYDPLNAVQPFVGLEFYRNIFTPGTPQAEFFWQTLFNTAFFVVISTPFLVGIPLLLAMQLNRPIFGRGFFRTIFFMPGILSVSVIGILWRWMFQDRVGLINAVRQQLLGLPTIPFLTTEWLAWIPIIVATIWWSVGFNMTVYLAALTAIPDSYYEAADLDGANGWAKFWYITFPLLSPTTLFVFVTTVLASFQLFGQSLLITGGGPTRSTQTIIMYITQEGFNNFLLSSATAMSFVFGGIMLVFTIFQFRLMVRDIRTTKVS
jgi:multiple sugar transport system permease protein